MVNVIFYNLLRSKYKLEEEIVKEGTINSIIEEIIRRYPNVKIADFKYSVVFHNGKPIHYQNYDRHINDLETIIFTHFVGGG